MTPVEIPRAPPRQTLRRLLARRVRVPPVAAGPYSTARQLTERPPASVLTPTQSPLSPSSSTAVTRRWMAAAAKAGACGACHLHAHPFGPTLSIRTILSLAPKATGCVCFGRLLDRWLGAGQFGRPVQTAREMTPILALDAGDLTYTSPSSRKEGARLGTGQCKATPVSRHSTRHVRSCGAGVHRATGGEFDKTSNILVAHLATRDCQRLSCQSTALTLLSSACDSRAAKNNSADIETRS